jgi:hypothetical protein
MPDARVDAVARLLVIAEYGGEDIWDSLLNRRMDAFQVAESLDRDLGDDLERWAEQEVARWRLNAEVLLAAADAADFGGGWTRVRQSGLNALAEEIDDLKSKLNHEHARAEGYY